MKRLIQKDGIDAVSLCKKCHCMTKTYIGGTCAKPDCGHDKGIIQVWCRDCGEKMKPAPYGLLVFYCNKCQLAAEVSYRKQMIVHAIGVE